MPVQRRSVRGDEDNWVETQCAVFKNWVNQNLMSRDMQLDKFETDFSDGIKLINLYEVVSKKKIGRYTKKPRLPNQMLENVTLALKAMEEDGINLVSIDSEHIVSGSLKLILGLIWRMILHYQIGAMTVKIPVKKLVLIWVQSVIPDQNITNLTQDWNSGKALCALVEAIKPGSCPGYNDLRDEDSIDNCRLGLKLADDNANIPQLISPEQMADPNIDEQSVMTYLSYFIQDEGIGEEHSKDMINSWCPELSFSNFNTDWNDGIRLCTLVEALSPGSIPEYKSLDPDRPLENLSLGMNKAESDLGVKKLMKPEDMANPDVTEIAVMAYLLQFRKSVPAKTPAPLRIISIVEEERDNEPVVVMEVQSPMKIPKTEEVFEEDQLVEEAEPEVESQPEETEIVITDQITVESEPEEIQIITETEPVVESEPEQQIIPEPDVETETEILPEDETRVETENAPETMVETLTEVIEEPLVEVENKPGEESTIIIENLAQTEPEPEMENDEVTSDMFVISGAGLTDPQIDTNNEFYVRCEKDFDHDSLVIKATGPALIAGDDDRDIPVEVDETNSRLITCRYPLDGAGLYTIDVMYKGEHVHRSPISIKIVQDLTRVTVSGSGLGQIFVHEPAEIKLETGLDEALIHAYTVSPSREELPAVVSNQGGGDFLIKYVPHQTGLYGLFINVNGENLPGSPYVAKVSDPDTVVITSSQNKEDKQIYVSPDQEVAVNVDISQSGADAGDFTATTTGPHHSKTPTDVIQNDDGTIKVAFCPPTVGYYHTDIFWGSRKLNGCPFIVLVSDPGKCVAHGEGLYQVRLNETAWFEVTTIGAGPGKLSATAECNGEEIPIELTKTEDNTYNGNYYPDSLSQVRVDIAYNDIPIRGSPFSVKVGNPSRCKFDIANPEPQKVGDEQSIMVHFDDEAGHGEVRCVVKGPTGNVPVMIIDTGENTKRIDFQPKTPGMHEVNVYFADALLAGCPYMIEVLEECDPSKVIASGDGLHQAPVNEIAKAHIDCRHAGKGELSATVMAEGTNVLAPSAIKDNEDGTYDLTYSVPSAAKYVLDIRYGSDHIPNSPFTVDGYSRADPTQVVLAGDGLKAGTAGKPVVFTLDGRNAGEGHLACHCKSPSGKDTYVLVTDNKDGTFTVDLNAKEPGVHNVAVEWDGNPIPGSPFLVRIMQAPDAGKVKVHGPGVKSGLLADFEGRFTVETRGAGPGTLKVRIHGPKGAFKVEMFRESEKDRTIGVRYNPKEIGKYTVNVLWSDQHAPGSPFELYVADNKTQLANLLNEAKTISINGHEERFVEPISSE